MSLQSMIDQFTSFIAGQRLVDGGDCLNLAKLVCAAQDALTALAGGGAAGATQLNYALNRFTTVATNNDSALLPNAVQGATVTVINDGANTLEIWPAQSNPNNAGAADTIAPHNTSVYGANATLAAAAVGEFYCPVNGKWKMTLMT